MQYYTKMGVHSTNWSDKKTLDLSAWLVPGSVKLYRAEKQKDGTVLKGDEIKNWTWTVQTSRWESGLAGRNDDRKYFNGERFTG